MMISKNAARLHTEDTLAIEELVRGVAPQTVEDLGSVSLLGHSGEVDTMPDELGIDVTPDFEELRAEAYSAYEATLTSWAATPEERAAAIENAKLDTAVGLLSTWQLLKLEDNFDSWDAYESLSNRIGNNNSVADVKRIFAEVVVKGQDSGLITPNQFAALESAKNARILFLNHMASDTPSPRIPYKD